MVMIELPQPSQRARKAGPPTTGSKTFSAPLDQSVSNSSSLIYNGDGDEGFCYDDTLEASGQSTTYAPPVVLTGPMIAGDGYAYVAYEYQTVTAVSKITEMCYLEVYGQSGSSSVDTVSHLELLRVGSDGSSSQIDVKDWDAKNFTQYTFDPNNVPGNYGTTTSEVNLSAAPTLTVSMITNADQGTMLGWEADTPAYCASSSGNPLPEGCNSTAPAASTFGIAATVGDSVASSATMSLPGQASLINPVLQAQDGTFIGSVGLGPSPGSVTQYNMIAFDSSGNLNWSVPYDSPQIATADGGVIGASGVTYDANGNATGQVPLPVYAWTGNAYQVDPGQAQQVASTPPDVATSFWPGGDANSPPGANASGTKTAYQSVKETLYVRSFAPFQWFGPDPLHVPPCLLNCFMGDNRSFTTSLSPTVTSRITGVVIFRLPGMAIIDRYAFSSPTYDKWGDTKTAKPDINAVTIGTDTLEMGFFGADPLIFPQSLAPYIKANWDMKYQETASQVCYSGSLHGNQFPDAEAFIVNSQNQASMLLTFTTTGDPNFGPWIYLPQDGTRDMGSFSNVCMAK